MNKAFTKEDDGPAAQRLPDLPVSPHPNYVTPQGLAALREKARAQADLVLELRAWRGEMQSDLPVAERDLRYLEARLASAIPVDPSEHPPGVVAFGACVTVEDEEGETRHYRIVGEDEADPARGLIAPFSPLAQAMLGTRVGDLVDWVRPSGTLELEITGISFEAPARAEG